MRSAGQARHLPMAHPRRPPGDGAKPDTRAGRPGAGHAGGHRGVLKRAHAPSALGSGAGEMYGVINWYHDSTSIGNHHDASPSHRRHRVPRHHHHAERGSGRDADHRPTKQRLRHAGEQQPEKAGGPPAGAPRLSLSASSRLCHSVCLCCLTCRSLFMCPFLIPRGRLALVLQAEGQDLGVHRAWPG
jgi:hypothetical protein